MAPSHFLWSSQATTVPIRFYASLERLLREHDQELGGTDEAGSRSRHKPTAAV